MSAVLPSPDVATMPGTENGDMHSDAPETDNGHDMDNMGPDRMVTVKPGSTRTLVHRFGTDETMLIGCHQPGHYEAGMKATVTVD